MPRVFYRRRHVVAMAALVIVLGAVLVARAVLRARRAESSARR